ncbi:MULTISPECIES: hypothetical protein [Ruegeria]|nr:MULTISPECIES: hypothetical protein [Ruegeria]UWR07530.1 hypothetical protein K3752_00750 [Ruegeria sp. B32]
MKNESKKTDAAKALEYLEQAWAYYEPEPVKPAKDAEPELFEYANAA